MCVLSKMIIFAFEIMIVLNRGIHVLIWIINTHKVVISHLVIVHLCSVIGLGFILW